MPINIFRPSESAYVNPGEYEKAVRAQALEEATFRSELGRFYRTLDEQKREFDLDLGERQRQFDITSGEQKREFDTMLDFQKHIQRFKESSWQQAFGLQKEQLDFTKFFNLEQLKLAKNKFGHDVETDWTNFIMNAGTSIYNIGSDQGWW